MKTLLLFLLIIAAVASTSCSKSDSHDPSTPRTDVPAVLQGSWMNGNFSMTEYWDEYPGNYLGNGFEAAFAFTFNADGSFTQYFSGAYVVNGVQTYQQSVSKGTVEIDLMNKTIKTHTTAVHYRRYEGKNMVEDRNLDKSEYATQDTYVYSLDKEADGSVVLNLTIDGTTSGARPFRRL